MATTRKAATTDPLMDELPDHPDLAPKAAADVTFDISIEPYIVSGEWWYRWNIENHSHQNHVQSYVGAGNGGLKTAEDAEADAKRFVERIRHTIQMKLSAPGAYKITL
jgi:hypothetical protein